MKKCIDKQDCEEEIRKGMETNLKELNAKVGALTSEITDFTANLRR